MPCQADEHSHCVKNAAAELGFELCGIARVSPADPVDHFSEWLARGYHANMDWLASSKEVRQDILRFLPGARSVVALAKNYHATPGAVSQAGELRVARYAWGRDYHRWMGKRMRRLAAETSALMPESVCRWCVDSGPVMERVWAERAGLGWIGKNGLLLHPEYGSWIFLGVLATTLELTPDEPMPNRCGTCERCLKGCPTGALVHAGVLDARRCLAYHTIENRGEIPEELHAHMRGWVFGCDACQEVCPWNRHTPFTSDRDCQPRPEVLAMDPARLLAMEREEFDLCFAGSPLRRAQCAGMQRNVRLAWRKAP